MVSYPYQAALFGLVAAPGVGSPWGFSRLEYHLHPAIAMVRLRGLPGASGLFSGLTPGRKTAGARFWATAFGLGNLDYERLMRLAATNPRTPAKKMPRIAIKPENTWTQMVVGFSSEKLAVVNTSSM